MTISNRIQYLRKKQGLSQEQLADRLGVSRQAVSKWESEQSLPDIDKIIAISEYFDVTTDWLLKGVQSQYKSETENNMINEERLSLTASCVNIVGFAITVALWRQWQNDLALLIGFVVIFASFFIMGMGISFLEKDKRKAVFLNWLKKVIWFDAVFPAFFFGNILSAILRKVTLFPWWGYIIIVFSTYLAICMRIVLFTNRYLKQSR